MRPPHDEPSTLDNSTRHRDPAELSGDSAVGNSYAGLGSASDEERNFLSLAAYLITMRIGWIFKTESIIMPVFLDMISGNSGWIRGFLPMFNRFGQSLPPILYARRLKVMPRKKWALFGFSMAMGLVFLMLAAVWFFVHGQRGDWLVAVFLGLYALFFVCTGLAQLANGTLQGKVVRVDRRGDLMTVSTTIGATTAILAAWWLLDDWLALGAPGFTYIFGFTGIFFCLSAVCTTWLVERADRHEESPLKFVEVIGSAVRIVRDDHRFRRLVVVAVLFSTVVLLFPHYQALARQRLGIRLDQLMLWVVVQNAGTGLFSTIAGPLADRRGNRLALTVVMFASAATPVLAVLLARQRAEGPLWFWVVFAMIGLTPIMFKLLTNYTLEVSAVEDHPRYLSTLSLCVAVPFCFSPLVGWLIDVTSFELVMFGGAALIALGGVLTLRLEEPRHVPHPAVAEITIDNVDVAVDE